MPSFATLIKLSKTHVDEQRLVLAKLQARLDEIERDIAELEIRQAREQVTVNEYPETALTYGAFLKWAIARARELENERQAAAVAVTIARDKLAELFEEQKRYEIAEQNRIEEEAREAARRERIEMDEIGSVSFVRKKKE
jgi:flagellar export protein FliJ